PKGRATRPTTGETARESGKAKGEEEGQKQTGGRRMNALEAWRENVEKVDSEALLDALLAEKEDGQYRVSEDIVSQLVSFGQFMLGSLEQRIGHRQGRAVHVAGLSLGVVAFLLLG